jgi:hypothetical protein
VKARGIAQWLSTCLTFDRLWVLTLALKKKKRKEGRKEEKRTFGEISFPTQS